MTTMTQDKGRCAVLRRYGQPLELREYPVSEPEPGGVLLRVTQASICGSDLHMWRGDTETIPLPAGGRALGHEGAAVIARLGEGVRTDAVGHPVRIGDRVVHSIVAGCHRCAKCLSGAQNLCRNKPPARSADEAPHFFGTFADYLSLSPGTPFFRVPDAVPDHVLSPVNCAMGTVLEGLLSAGVGPGSSVVLCGAGGLGLAGVALAKYLGASQVIAVDRLANRLALAQEFGADEIVDVSAVPESADRVRLVQEMTGGGADAVLELVGLADLITEGVAMLDRGGSLVEIGIFWPGQRVQFDPSTVVASGKRIVGSNGYRPQRLPVILDFLAQTHDRLPFGKLVSHRFALEDINRAFAESEWTGNGTAVVRAVLEP